MCLLTIHISSLEKCLFESSTYFFYWGVFCFILLYCTAWAVCIFWRVILCQLLYLQIFSPILRVSFHLVYGFISCAKALKFNYVQCLFLFLFSLLWEGSKKILLWFMSKSILPMFSYRSFIVSGLIFRSLIHFEFIILYGVSGLVSFFYM